ncbi:hypothetical protein WSM22_07820 [Cytophagales bacterium WSM2-2]|nr:hypothetical protein WSM22_07820 [Cytophagales bacterium WSM2-2]
MPEIQAACGNDQNQNEEDQISKIITRHFCKRCGSHANSQIRKADNNNTDMDRANTDRFSKTDNHDDSSHHQCECSRAEHDLVVNIQFTKEINGEEE